MSHEYIFRTDSMEQAQTWWSKLEGHMGNAPRGDTAGALTEESEGEEEAGGVAGVTGGRRVRAEPGQGVTQQMPARTAAPTATAGTVPVTQGTHPAVVPGGNNNVQTAAPTATTGVVAPPATTGVAAPTATATATRPQTTTGA